MTGEGIVKIGHESALFSFLLNLLKVKYQSRDHTFYKFRMYTEFEEKFNFLRYRFGVAEKISALPYSFNANDNCNKSDEFF